MIPLIVLPGSGSELYRGIGSVVLGGLVTSTMFTLFLVPSLFSLALESKEWIQNALRRRPEVTPGLQGIPIASAGPVVDLPSPPKEPATVKSSATKSSDKPA